MLFGFKGGDSQMPIDVAGPCPVSTVPDVRWCLSRTVPSTVLVRQPVLVDMRLTCQQLLEFRA